MNRKEQINRVMDRFNFVELEYSMRLLNWTWATYDGGLEVPTVDMLISKGRYLLNAVYDSLLENPKPFSDIGTGGFFATAFMQDGEIVGLRLAFELESWDSSDYDYKYKGSYKKEIE